MIIESSFDLLYNPGNGSPQHRDKIDADMILIRGNHIDGRHIVEQRSKTTR